MRTFRFGTVLRDALDDLRALPVDARERSLPPRLMLQPRGELARMTEIDPTNADLAMTYDEIVTWADGALSTLRAASRARGVALGAMPNAMLDAPCRFHALSDGRP